MPWLPKSFIGAVKKDFDKFIVEYRKTNSDTFQSFEKVWFELSFDLYHCFSGRRGRSKSCIEFIIDQMNGILVSYFNSDDRIEKVCALYLLYGLFHTQPLKTPIRIRLDPEEYNTLSEFASQNLEINPEIYYCYWKLMHDNCIDFVLSPFPYTPPYIVVKQKKEKKKVDDDFRSLIKRIGVDFDVDSYLNGLDEYTPLRSKLDPYLPEAPWTIKTEECATFSGASQENTTSCAPMDIS